MAEELDIAGVLEKLKPYADLNPFERILAAHTGTVQLLLSLYFNQEVVVEVQSQEERDGGAYRKVVLRLKESQQEVCWALSHIDFQRCTGGVVVDVRSRELGLGQIALKGQINTERTLMDLRVEVDRIQRTYIMEGPGLYYEITEIFPRALYRQAHHE